LLILFIVQFPNTEGIFVHNANRVIIRRFRLGNLYRYNLPNMNAATLKSFAEDGFRNSKAEDIPKPKTPL